MEPASGDRPLPVGDAGRCRHLHPGAAHQDRHPQHPLVVHRRPAAVLHGHHHPVCDRAHFDRVGRGAEVGGHHQARLRQHRPHLPQQQAHRHRRRLPRRLLVRPPRLGQWLAGEGEGAEDQGDQEREAGDVGGDGRMVPGHLHRNRAHRQPLRAPCRPRPCHSFRCK
ncbi:Chlorophyll A-B binding protein [Musa troglodytarum]|uniref:Chlorophyll A-B binding protein n=1 Tax=Musa troglodytarum TaxID=320322 RepID=A0A9E7HP21_9LILI|nr:Chlorophyll A-B binding protein [Musa troglodytarum]